MVKKARKEEAEDNGEDEDEDKGKGKGRKAKSAKDDDNGKGKGKGKKPTPPAREEYEYDVAALAKRLDLSPFSVRVKLRDAGIKKAGRSYGWDSKKEFEKVVSQLES